VFVINENRVDKKTAVGSGSVQNI